MMFDDLPKQLTSYTIERSSWRIRCYQPSSCSSDYTLSVKHSRSLAFMFSPHCTLTEDLSPVVLCIACILTDVGKQYTGRLRICVANQLGNRLSS